MPQSFQVSALQAQFCDWFEMSDDALAQRGAKRCTADTAPGYPCRVSLQDAEVGEELILLSFVHHDTTSPYRASGPSFVRRGAEQAQLGVNEVPDSVRLRLMSVRAYDSGGFLKDAEVTEGRQIERVIKAFFADTSVEYLHLHNARPGCYSCRIDRA